MNQEVFERLVNRPTDSNKYNFGHVLVVGGSPGMVGAPLLTGKAALRVGAGLVTLASTQAVVGKLEKRVEEIMTLGFPSDYSKATEIIGDYINVRKVSVLVIGPGLTIESMGLVKQLIKSINLPIVLDGGGFAAVQDEPEVLKGAASKNIIMTPHLGEFQRFFAQTLPKERDQLKPIAKKFAKDFNVTLVLKGHPTYVSHPDGEIYTNTTGGPELATAGSGDVLSGIIAGIMAQRISSGSAAEAGVYLHGLAGDLAAEKNTEAGVIASDVIEAIPTALKKLGDKNNS